MRRPGFEPRVVNLNLQWRLDLKRVGCSPQIRAVNETKLDKLGDQYNH